MTTDVSYAVTKSEETGAKHERPPTHSQQLTDNILSVTNDDIPASAYDATKRLLLDTFGCALAGRGTPGVGLACGVNRPSMPWASTIHSFRGTGRHFWISA